MRSSMEKIMVIVKEKVKRVRFWIRREICTLDM